MTNPCSSKDFVFLSTPSARRATYHCGVSDVLVSISIHALREEGDPFSFFVQTYCFYFYPRPPRGGRRLALPYFFLVVGISIHALREEGDKRSRFKRISCKNFYPRPPRGGRQQKQRENPLLLSHYTPPCTNCKEASANQTAKSHRYLRKRLVFRCEASRKTMCAACSHWRTSKDQHTILRKLRVQPNMFDLSLVIVAQLVEP